MEWICKINTVTANTIIDTYLGIVKIPSQYYKRSLYQGFSSNFGRNNLIDDVLLPEQNHKCCYCMRRMCNHRDGTIEHIIPESIQPQDMDHYFDLGLNGLDSSNICHTEQFMSGNSLPGQYPHEVAYYNYAMACPKCNERRGCKTIHPLFLYPNIKNEVFYIRQTGKVIWRNEPNFLDPTIEKLELNSNQLKAIRSVWIYGHDHPTSTYSTPDTVNSKLEREELVYRAFGESLLADENTSLDTYLGLLNEAGWNLLLEYQYFASV